MFSTYDVSSTKEKLTINLIAMFKMKSTIPLAEVVVLILLCFSANGNSQDIGTILVEAESFDTYGGWFNDTQFMDQMGSPYQQGNPIVHQGFAHNIQGSRRFSLHDHETKIHQQCPTNQ